MFIVVSILTFTFVCTCACVGVHGVCMHMDGGQRLMPSVFLRHVSTLLLRRSFSESRAHQCSLAGVPVKSVTMSPALGFQMRTAMPGFLKVLSCEFWASKFRSHAYTASNLSAEPSPQALWFVSLLLSTQSDRIRHARLLFSMCFVYSHSSASLTCPFLPLCRIYFNTLLPFLKTLSLFFHSPLSGFTTYTHIHTHAYMHTY